MQKEFAEWLKQQEYEENSKMKSIKNIAYVLGVTPMKIDVTPALINYVLV